MVNSLAHIFWLVIPNNVMRSRLLVFTENYSRGGGNRYMLDLVRALSDDFVEIIVASNPGGIFPEELSRLPSKAKVLNLKIASKNKLRINKLKYFNDSLFVRVGRAILLLFLEPLLFLVNQIVFFRLILKVKPSEILICNGGYPGGTSCLTLAWTSKIFRIPTSMSIVSTPTARRRYLSNLESQIDLAVWSSCKIVITNCDSASQLLIKLRGLPNSKAAVIYNGVVDIEISLLKNYSARQSSDKIVIGFVSRLEKAKGVFVLFEAFRELVSRFENLELVYFGSGNAQEDLSLLIQRNGLVGKVKMEGHHFGEISQVLSQIDVYVSPSFWEGLPYSLVEAMRSGLAIVATNVGGTEEALKDSISGLIVHPDSSESLMDALTRVIVSPEMLTRLGNAARESYLEKFQYYDFEQRVQKLFKS